MTPRPYTEDDLVQQTTAKCLEERLGWKSVYAHNREDFGPDSLLGRNSDREVVLTRPLRAALAALNPGLPGAAYDDAVRQLVATDASKSIVAANREKYDLLRDGVSVTFTDTGGKPAKRRLRVFDFETPENNDFLAVRELSVRSDLYRRRPDLVGFVNGLPLLFVECKNIHRNLRVAFEKNYRDYHDTIPHLFHHNAIVMFANGESAKIGSVTSEWGHFHEWKRLAEEEPGAVDMETLLKGVCDRRNFLGLFENFILFDDSAGAVRKILARNHQFLGVNRAVEAVRDAIHIVYHSLQQDRQRADTGGILRELHRIVDAAVDTGGGAGVAESGPYDLSGLDFERLKKEFERNRAKRTRVQELKQAIETRLRKLLERNPRRVDLQARFDEIVAAYNREKDRATIERTFEELLKLVRDLDREELRAVREGLDEESLALFDLLQKDRLTRKERARVKEVAVGLLEVVKVEVRRVSQWREKEATRDTVRSAIHDFLWDDATGLPSPRYSDDEVQARVDEVYLHVFRAYPEVPSPYYESDAAA